MRIVRYALLIMAMSVPAASLSAAVIDDIRTSDVAVESGANVTDAQVSALRASALEITASGKPTKFIVLASKPADVRQYAAGVRSQLRQDSSFRGQILALALTTSNGNALSISGPYTSTYADRVFSAFKPQLKADPVAGTIAVAKQLASGAPVGGSGIPSTPPAGSGSSSGSKSGSGSSGGLGFGALLAIVGAVFVGLVSLFNVMGRRRRRRAAEAELAARKAALDPLVDGLATYIGDLDGDITLAPDGAPAARAHYDQAVAEYGAAREKLGSATTESEIARIGEGLERGLRAAQAARAVLDGKPIPPSDAPLLEGLCSFDPKHGKASATFPIDGPQGSVELPVCQSCADRLAVGDRPPVRTVPVGGHNVPYWNIPGPGSGWGGRGGGFGGGWLVPVIGGMILSDILTPDRGWATDSGGSGGNDSNWGSGDSGGSFGGDGGAGGDFGGGDLGGGGGWTGGDMGRGGDFGGGGDMGGGGGDF